MVEVAAVAGAEALSASEHADLLQVAWPMWATRDHLAQTQAVWFDQGFEFYEQEASLACFMRQKKNGPCGVLSGLQALTVQELLFPSLATSGGVQRPVRPQLATAQQRDEAFARAAAMCLLQAGEGSGRLLVPHPHTHGLEAQTPTGDPQLPADAFFAGNELVVHSVPDLEMLVVLILGHREVLYSPIGVVLLLYSLILSRGVANVRADGKASYASLIYEDACCEQAVVHLLLTGRATNEVDSGAWATWSGMPRVGFLTIMTEYEPAPIFKNPAYPVWVVHGGGHYTVMWADSADVLQVVGQAAAPIPPPLPDLTHDLLPLPTIDEAPSAGAAQVAPMDVGSDDALQRALALSLQEAGGATGPDSQPVWTTHEPTPTPTPTPAPAAAPEVPVEPMAVATHSKTEEELLAEAIALSMQPLHEASPPSLQPAAKLDETLRGDFGEGLAATAGTTTSVGTSAAQLSDGRGPEAIQLGGSNPAAPAANPGEAMSAGAAPEDSDLAMALALSVQEMESAGSAAAPYDDEMARAIAASLSAISEPPAGSNHSHTFYHYNGLHPPASEFPVRVARFTAFLKGRTKQGEGVSDEAKAQNDVNRARRVQRILDYKALSGGTKENGPWRFLVVCHRDGSMEPGAGNTGMQGQRVPGEKWRCRDCYLRDPPVWAAFNEPEAEVCKECLKPVAECGFCHWLRAEDLEASLRAGWDRQHAPQVLQVMWTRWPFAELDFDEPPPALWG